MSALLDSIKETLSSEKAKARRLYASIVRREGTPDARSGDAADLRKAMATLGYGEDVLARHVAALAEAKGLEQSIPDDADTYGDALTARQADRQREAATCRAKRRDLMEQFRTCAERERELERETAEDEKVSRQRIGAVEDARARLAALRQANAIVLADE